ncbi:MAG: hypothetical protein BMS9Abin13_176 [Patescibacteria group bacterium]|nr:MAG: hypothetical protein BMS9Abin13_176 [Patescibacteria group bacterium]
MAGVLERSAYFCDTMTSANRDSVDIMTNEHFDVVKEFAGAVTEAIISVMGVSAVDALLKETFPKGEICIDQSKKCDVRQEHAEENVKKLLAALVDRATADFGYEFSETILATAFDDLKKKHPDNPHMSEILWLVPEMSLEEEKIRSLPREKLERHVLERAKMIKKLEEENKDLEALNKTKGEFLYTVAHEMRTSLTAMKWILRELQESSAISSNTQNKEYVDDMLVSNERIVRLINNLLNVARMEEEDEKLFYQFQRLSAGDVVDEVVRTLSPMAEHKSITLKYSSPSERIFVLADKDKFYLSIENIIDNAIKYTPRDKGAEIEITITKKANKAVIAVRDEGIGIAKDDQSRIFSKFFRAGSAAAHKISGTGLGLFIVRKIIEHHNGRLYFESEEGAGTTFSIELPLAPEADAENA